MWAIHEDSRGNCFRAGVKRDRISSYIGGDGTDDKPSNSFVSLFLERMTSIDCNNLPTSSVFAMKVERFQLNALYRMV